jgi:hypothetical protein
LPCSWPRHKTKFLPTQRCCTRAPTLPQRQARLQTSNREQQKYSKYSKYREIARAAGKTFYPLVHEAHGRVGDAAREVLKICVQKIAAALRRQPVASVSSLVGVQNFPWRFKSLRLERSHERFRDSLLAHNVGSGESSRLNYRGIALERSMIRGYRILHR